MDSFLQTDRQPRLKKAVQAGGPARSVAKTCRLRLWMAVVSRSRGREDVAGQRSTCSGKTFCS